MTRYRIHASDDRSAEDEDVHRPLESGSALYPSTSSYGSGNEVINNLPVSGVCSPSPINWKCIVFLIISCLSSLVAFSVMVSMTEQHDFDYSSVNDVADWKVFQTLDVNGDGYLSVEEFLPYVHSCRRNMFDTMRTAKSHNAAQGNADSGQGEDISATEEVITITAEFLPLSLTSLTKDLSDMSRNPEQSGSLKGLLLWKRPRTNWTTMKASEFKAFLPPSDVPCDVGSSWWIIPPPSTPQQLSSARYAPLEVHPSLLPVVKLLRLFHSNPFLHTRFSPQGSVAVLRAIKEDMLDIVFRMHVEFQLNQPPEFPFWFTPSQFHGRIVLTKDLTKVFHFHAEVPTNRKLNVDMEWLNGPNEMENMEVDIGFVPKMSLESTSPSIPAADALKNKAADLNISNACVSANSSFKETLNALQWDASITMDKAEEILRKKMYPFTEVKYYNFTDAFAVAEKESKLVHAIVLWGALDDQSC